MPQDSGTGEIAQLVKIFATKTNQLSLVPGIFILEERIKSHEWSLTSTHVLWSIYFQTIMKMVVMMMMINAKKVSNQCHEV